MATKGECFCIENAAGIIMDAKVLDASSRSLNTLIRMSRVGQETETTMMSMIRDNAQKVLTGTKSFERACDISKLGDRLKQYQLGKDELEQFRNEPENLDLVIDAGTRIYGAVLSKIGKELIECK